MSVLTYGSETRDEYEKRKQINETTEMKVFQMITQKPLGDEVRSYGFVKLMCKVEP
jgi:hypothetical protein